MKNDLPAWAFWDNQNEFTLSEIGWLWCDLEPPTTPPFVPTPNSPPSPLLPPMPAMGTRIMTAICRANPPLEPCPNVYLNGWVYSRTALHAWAEQQGYRPLFLFPDLRPEKQTDLSLDGALQVIAALAKLAHPQQAPDKRAYGLIPKIEQAGCNLERKAIGKYLNAAKKIKNFG